MCEKETVVVINVVSFDRFGSDEIIIARSQEVADRIIAEFKKSKYYNSDNESITSHEEEVVY